MCHLPWLRSNAICGLLAGHQPQFDRLAAAPVASTTPTGNRRCRHLTMCCCHLSLRFLHELYPMDTVTVLCHLDSSAPAAPPWRFAQRQMTVCHRTSRHRDDSELRCWSNAAVPPLRFALQQLVASEVRLFRSCLPCYWRASAAQGLGVAAAFRVALLRVLVFLPWLQLATRWKVPHVGIGSS